MCGICGIYNQRSGRPVTREVVERMTATIRHRGPDDEGIFVEGPLGLGMRRLSIIDLDHGSQPIWNEAGTIGVVFNGEIYNFQPLRERLEAGGHQFRTDSDTEVLVHLYEEHGDDLLEHINGMFAFALWDKGRQRLLLARDRLGVKPLYYAWTADGLVFGSELKCLLASGAVAQDLDRESVYHYFTLGYIPHPWSIYRGARQLPPAHLLVVDEAGMAIRRYWEVQPRIDETLNKSDVRDQLRDLLVDATRIRMISDVPLGAFLSGGLDSSITVAMMARQSSEPIKTFFIDFDEDTHSERQYARAVAERYGTDHHELVVRPNAAEILDELVRFFDEPFGDASAVPTYYVAQITRQHVTVALAGDGGDETFGGYRRYQRILDRRSLPSVVRRGMGTVGAAVSRFMPRTAPGRRYLRSLGMSNDELFAVGTDESDTRELLSRELLASLNGTSTFAAIRHPLSEADSGDPLARYTNMDLHRYLPDDILVKVDRMSMAHSLEVRAPFLDYRVAELAARIPCDWKIAAGDTKVLLKETFGGDLPASVLRPRKRGFSMPLAVWLRKELRPALEEAIESREVADSGLFRISEVRGMAEEHFRGARDRSGQLWRFLFFARWCNQTRFSGVANVAI